MALGFRCECGHLNLSETDQRTCEKCGKAAPPLERQQRKGPPQKGAVLKKKTFPGQFEAPALERPRPKTVTFKTPGAPDPPAPARPAPPRGPTPAPPPAAAPAAPST